MNTYGEFLRIGCSVGANDCIGPLDHLAAKVIGRFGVFCIFAAPEINTMMKLQHFFGYLSLATLVACSGCNDSNSKEDPNAEQNPVSEIFAEGADVSWITEQEARGHKFYNTANKAIDGFELMKELGLNAVRLRVWVDPKEHDNWCNTADMVAKAKRAADLNMDVMVDFHYSDWWADPGQQHKPAAWKGLGLVSLKRAIYDHTVEVMQALKEAGVTPKWVQVGNEIRPGMLWDEDAALSGASYDIRACDVKGSNSTSTEVKYRKNLANLAAFINEGYKAVKSVFAQAQVIVHLDNGYDKELYTWFFDELQKQGGQWDVIGMSIYPYWTQMEHPDYADEKVITDCIDNVNLVSQRYNCDVIIVETGMECADEKGQLASEPVLQRGKALLSLLIKESKTKTNGRCKGVFYWEPQCTPQQYRLGAFTADGRPTAIMEAFAEQ